MLEPLPPLQAPPTAGYSRSIVYVALVAMAFGGIGALGCGIQPLSISLNAYKVGGLLTESGTLVSVNQDLLKFNTIAAVLDLLTSTALFVTAYAALRRWHWGRRAAVFVAALILAVALGKLIGSLTIFRQPWVDDRLAGIAAMTDKQRQDMNVPADYVEQIQAMSYRAPVLMFVIQSLVPGLLLLVWTRAGVKAVFDGKPAAQ